MSTQNINLRDQPAYGLGEAARYLKLPAATLSSWVVGRPYPKGDSVARFQPLIKPARKKPTLLSFYNMIEAHVLRSLRDCQWSVITTFFRLTAPMSSGSSTVGCKAASQ